MSIYTKLNTRITNINFIFDQIHPCGWNKAKRGGKKEEVKAYNFQKLFQMSIPTEHDMRMTNITFIFQQKHSTGKIWNLCLMWIHTKLNIRITNIKFICDQIHPLKRKEGEKCECEKMFNNCKTVLYLQQLTFYSN